MKKYTSKFVLIMAASALSLSLYSPVSANEQESLVTNEIQNAPLYTYEYNGIEFSGNVQLSPEELKAMYNDVLGTPSNLLSKSSTSSASNASNGSVSILAEDNGSSYVKESSTYYRTYKNTTVKIAAELATAFIISKTPKKIRSSTFGAWMFGKFQGWVSGDKTTYVGSWISSTWSSYQNKRLYKATVVHYKNSNYTTPLSVQYYDISQWY